MDHSELKLKIQSKKDANRDYFLSLLDDENQRSYEEKRLKAVMLYLRLFYINRYKLKIRKAKEEIEALKAEGISAENYQKILSLSESVNENSNEINRFKCFFDEPYFARMDLVDDIEGYNSYYIGKCGDVNLEIVDWRAPIAKRYYQKSRISFSINEYDYKVVLRRALRTKCGRFIELKNEYLNLKDYLTKEELADKAAESVLDPFLKEILIHKKEQDTIKDIIETIQEKQYEIITKPERDNYVLHGCAGSGKTMIMLHRLSYLMYNNERLKARNILVLTPSNSFNDFIDELSSILELERVTTVTPSDYYVQLLKNSGIETETKMVLDAKESVEYLKYIYSNRFKDDLDKQLYKVFDGLYGMFAEKSTRPIIDGMLKTIENQRKLYDHIKNASVRVRRCVLGEIKEKDGKLCYTKNYRTLMNSLLDCEEFLRHAESNRMQTPDFFYKQLFVFYKSAVFVYQRYEELTKIAKTDLNALAATVESEVFELRRHKVRQGGKDVELYPERISVRYKILDEIKHISERLDKIEEGFTLFNEFYFIIAEIPSFKEIGKCKNELQLARYFYSAFIKPIKLKYNMTMKGLYKSDAYVLCMLLCLLGKKLEPRYSLVFIDEGQDISENEYWMLRKINDNASFNVFGDLAQNITEYRGLTNWDNCVQGDVYTLNQNYRNTNQIVEYVANSVGVDMRAIGLNGPNVKTIGMRGINSYFKDIKGLKAIIVSESNLDVYKRKSYNVLSKTNKISKNRINIMTVYESKGLEFTAVAVCVGDLTPNEKYIACTRALRELAIIE